MNKRKVRSFYTPFSGDSLRLGARHLLQVGYEKNNKALALCSGHIIITITLIVMGPIYLTSTFFKASGLGKLKPNTLVMGFKANWRESAPESIEDYINTI